MLASVRLAFPAGGLATAPGGPLGHPLLPRDRTTLSGVGGSHKRKGGWPEPSSRFRHGASRRWTRGSGRSTMPRMLEGPWLRGAPPLRVRVPASTSNLGPGFDLLGAALSLELEATVLGPSPGGGHRLREASGPGGADWPAVADDLLVRAFERALTTLGGSVGGGFDFAVASEIPHGRGLGSSGAAIVAGLLLGAALAPQRIAREDLLGWAIELEGHPDNVAPSLLGGCVLAVPAAPRPLVVRQAVHPSIAFALAWPEARLATSVARALLPERVPLADAVETARRLALLLEGLRSGDSHLLAAGIEDRLHVPHRLPRIPGGLAALGAAREAGAWAATISGSGTALVALAPHERARAAAEAMAAALRAATGAATARVATLVAAAPVPEPVGAPWEPGLQGA